MPVTALTSRNVDRPVGGDWPISVLVTDADDTLAEVAPIVTVTLPDGSTVTPTVESVTTGAYRAVYLPATPGRYIAVAAVAGYGAVTFVAFVSAITAAGGLPDVAEVGAYLAPHSWTDEQLQVALDAEAAAQRKAVAVPAEYGPDLREALMRRVAVNLAKRRIPLAVLQGDADAGVPGSTVPVSDPEIGRLERPYRRFLVA